MPVERNLVNEEVVEAINARPPWMLRNGLVLVFCVIAMVVTSSVFITYPEVMATPVRLTQGGTDFRFELPASYQVDSLFVGAGQKVDAGERLARISAAHGSATRIVETTVPGIFHRTSNFETGQDVLLVAPESSTDLKVLARVNEKQIAKVKKGQQVHIKLSSFPYREYGYLEGTIGDVPPVAINEDYTVTINLRKGSTTNTGKTIPFKNQLTGTCEIEVERVSIFKRLFRQLFRF